MELNVRELMNNICDLIVDHLEEIEETRYDVTYKSDNTPVTTSDVFVEKLVREYVQSTLQSVSFIGEESFDFSNAASGEFMVILDPIDGTENFTSGLKEWGVSFGIWQQQTHLGSFLLLPEMGIRLLTGDKIHPVRSRLTGLSSSMSDEVIHTLRQPGEYRIIGCAVYNIYNVIRGSYSRFVNPKGAYVWDILPGIMLALEHGCTVFINDEIYNGEILDPRQTYRIDIRR